MSNPTIEHRIKLTLDYSVEPLAALEATKCNFIYSWMKTHHPAWKGTGKIEVEVCLIDMGREYKGTKAYAAITQLGLVKAPDNLPLWRLSGEKPDLQREIGIMDPGSVWRGEDIAYLCGSFAYRDARLRSVQLTWRRLCRVLALSK